MNVCMLLGRIVRDLELKDANGTSLLRFSIAVGRKYKDSKGNNAEEVNFLDCVAWDKGAEIIAKHFKKGDPIILNTSAKQEQWTAQDGTKRSAVVFRVNSFEFVPGSGGKRKSDDEDAGSSDSNDSSSSSGGSSGGDDIPF